MKRYTRLIIVLVVLCLTLSVPVTAQATDNQRASLFFFAHSVYIYKTGANTYNACFDVTGNGSMQEIGARSLAIQQSSDGVNWTTIRTYTREYYPQMIAQNTGTHYWYFSRSATSGCCYRLEVVLWAKDYRGSGEITVYSDPVWF